MNSTIDIPFESIDDDIRVGDIIETSIHWGKIFAAISGIIGIIFGILALCGSSPFHEQHVALGICLLLLSNIVGFIVCYCGCCIIGICARSCC